MTTARHQSTRAPKLGPQHHLEACPPPKSQQHHTTTANLAAFAFSPGHADPADIPSLPLFASTRGACPSPAYPGSPSHERGRSELPLLPQWTSAIRKAMRATTTTTTRNLPAQRTSLPPSTTDDMSRANTRCPRRKCTTGGKVSRPILPPMAPATFGSCLAPPP